MLENTAIEVGPSRFARAVGVLLIGAIAIAPAGAPTTSTQTLVKHSCSMSAGSVRPHASIRTRAEGVNPRYLQRDFTHAAAPAR